jgi:hypothetical protein
MSGLEAQPVPDPLAFTARALERRGALLEEEEGGEVLALLPMGLSRELGLAEEVRLSAQGRQDAVACGLGTPLLETVVGEARREVPVASARWVREPAPKTGHARSLAERYVIRNGVAEVLEVAGGEATYLVAWLAYVAEADERHEGMVAMGVHAQDGSVPDEGFVSGCDAGAEGAWVPWPLPTVEPEARRWLARYALAVEQRALQGVREATARRHARDYERMAEYYAAMVAEARAPRRRVDAAAVETKVRHLLAERDSKLGDLAERFTLRVHTRLAAALWVAVPVARVRLRVRRRKGEHELLLRLPAGAHGFDRLPCEGCPGTTERPTLCDERLHVLCEACVPLATGRPQCPTCRA